MLGSRSESSRRAEIAVWCALVVLLLAGMRGLVYRVRLQFGDVTGSFLDDRPTQVVFHALYVVALAVGLGTGRIRIPGRVVVPLVALSTTLIASTAWSIDRGRTLNQSLLFASGTLAVAILSSRLQPIRLLSAVVAACSIAVVASVFARALDWKFSVDRHGRLTGVFYNRNSLGAVAVMLVVASASWWWLERSRPSVRWFGPFLVASGLVVWWRSGSATSMIAAVAGLAAGAWVVGRPRVPSRWRRTYSTVPAVVVLASIVAFAWRDTLAGWIGRDATFTGRTSTWDLLIDTWQRRPLVGFGYFAGWFDPALRVALKDIGYNHWEAHNGYLEVLLGAGLIGVAVLVWFLVAVGRVLNSRLDFVWSPWWVAAVVFALVSNIGETNIGPNRFVWFVLVSAVMSAAGSSPDRSARAD